MPDNGLVSLQSRVSTRETLDRLLVAHVARKHVRTKRTFAASQQVGRCWVTADIAATNVP
jgi:hypothetical protein